MTYLSLSMSTSHGISYSSARRVSFEEADRVGVRFGSNGGVGDVSVHLGWDEVGPDTSSDSRSDTLRKVENDEVTSGNSTEICSDDRVSNCQSE